MQEATIYLAWDETGTYTVNIDAEGAIADLEEVSEGLLQQAVALKVALPLLAIPELAVAIDDRTASPRLRLVKDD